jgi:hypothetical protein
MPEAGAAGDRQALREIFESMIPILEIHIEASYSALAPTRHPLIGHLQLSMHFAHDSGQPELGGDRTAR